MKNGTEVNLNLSSNVIGNSNDETNFLHKLLSTKNLSSNVIGDSNDKTSFLHKLILTDRQVSSLCKAFANNSSATVKLSKTRLPKIVQSGRLLGNLLGP